ncbi:MULTISPECIES: hypothetical protein [unclassified Methylophilus]|uniref:hypothetical protein n=1 Tax=unclassified Methylophilus TaxID=2630143 RepID=UPI0009E7E285|nr:MULTISPECIES: hypothetical protein [unclassified Methylophilus]
MKTIFLNQELLLNAPEYAELLVDESRKMLLDMSNYYPNFTDWFDQTVIPGLESGERTIILLKDMNKPIAGLGIVKDTLEEKKLCCLRVRDQYNGSGLGVRLFKHSFAELGTDMPLLSVSSEKLPEFKRVFDYFGFEFGEEYTGIYRPKKKEMSFNGELLNTKYSF